MHKNVTRSGTERGQYLAGAEDIGSEGKYYVEDQANQEKPPNRDTLEVLEVGCQVSRVRLPGGGGQCAREALSGVSRRAWKGGLKKSFPPGAHRRYSFRTC